MCISPNMNGVYNYYSVKRNMNTTRYWFCSAHFLVYYICMFPVVYTSRLVDLDFHCLPRTLVFLAGAWFSSCTMMGAEFTHRHSAFWQGGRMSVVSKGRYCNYSNFCNP